MCQRELLANRIRLSAQIQPALSLSRPNFARPRANLTRLPDPGQEQGEISDLLSLDLRRRIYECVV